MPLYVNVPIDDPSMHNQTQLLDVDDETFNHSFDPKKPSAFVRFYRLICFIVFLGPIKFVVCISSFIIFYMMLWVLPIFRRFFKNNIDFKKWAAKVTYPAIRMILFGAGVIHMKVNGEFKEDTRTVVTNHLTGLDAASLFLTVPCQFLATAGARNNTLCYRGSLVFDMIYVDRTKAEGVTKQIGDAQNDPTRLPVAIFPEGRVTNGSCTIGFRSGAFVADTPVQPIAIRYKHWLMPESMATIAWCEWNFLLYVYQLFSVPFYTLEVTILDQMVNKNSEKKPDERAKEAELAIANYLGCPALSKTNKGTLTGRPKEKKE
ncbi:Acyltransferase family protein [Tritrichomonas foetus]|uniref:Acyltransferase family protein n=1 Tax=Tritrichomonas foetus TaxID=1144522 RepID=A0A1J4KW01_9EUKA|nr:Acyltransferase family protein [Tritrichomonas foetus]|eukprot:OHT15407.1 Acyltransferase family protein [Tritrichomonas foetus]